MGKGYRRFIRRIEGKPLDDLLHETKEAGQGEHDWYDQLAAFFRGRSGFIPSRQILEDHPYLRPSWEQHARSLGMHSQPASGTARGEGSQQGRGYPPSEAKRLSLRERSSHCSVAPSMGCQLKVTCVAPPLQSVEGNLSRAPAASADWGVFDRNAPAVATAATSRISAIRSAGTLRPIKMSTSLGGFGLCQASVPTGAHARTDKS
jgi:hypothetical protein